MLRDHLMTPLAASPINDQDVLARINALPEPRHLFVLPTWLDADTLDRLIELEYLTCTHCQRSHTGTIQVAMGLELTLRGKRMSKPEVKWQRLALQGSLAGASFTAISVLILYLG